MSVTVIHSIELVSDAARTPDAWVAFVDDRVHAVGTHEGWRARFPDAAAIDGASAAGPGAVLTPGFIDLHGHGGGGFSYEGDDDSIRRARAAHRSHGTTSSVLSLVSGTVAHLRTQLQRIARLRAEDPGILGVHLEGPFLDPAHRGAHDPAALTAPTRATVDALVDAGGSTLRQVTLAPELDGGAEAIELFTSAGVVVAVGHTGADYAAARAAFDGGARLLTHAFNAMPGLHHREPGPVAAALADPRVTLEIIADGVHVHPELIRMLCAAAPGRVALVTDAMAAAGSCDGHYLLGTVDVTVTNRVARLTDGGAIAGSTLTHDAAIRTAVAAGVPLVAAVDAATAVPARTLGETEIGVLAPGARADAVLLTADLHVRNVWHGGVGISPTAAP